MHDDTLHSTRDGLGPNVLAASLEYALLLWACFCLHHLQTTIKLPRKLLHSNNSVRTALTTPAQGPQVLKDGKLCLDLEEVPSATI